jgi:Ser/Thr protein kinase RdoA (MazF antagonist)
MRGSLGEKIGEGAFADVHAWAPGQVVKLFKPGVRRRVALYEAWMTRAVLAAGIPVPEVLDEVNLEGRFGIVLSRFDGPTLLQLSRTGGVTFEEAGAILATLALSVHKTPPPPDALYLHDYMERSLRATAGMLPEDFATAILTMIERLSPGDGLCHCDLQPANVIMTKVGPRLIDWSGTVRAPAALDLAASHILLSEIAPEIAHNPERPRAVNAAMQSEYARLAGRSVSLLTEAMEPYLPIVRVFALMAGAFPSQRERLIQRVEEGLRMEGLI